jgi:predicted ATPase
MVDPNRVICEKQTLVGSRLATKRVCKTRTQWADERLQERQEVERVQTRRGISAPDE